MTTILDGLSLGAIYALIAVTALLTLGSGYMLFKNKKLAKELKA